MRISSDTASASVKVLPKLGQWREGPTMIKTDNVRLEPRNGNSHAF